jgi:hypothetical protein
MEEIPKGGKVKRRSREFFVFPTAPNTREELFVPVALKVHLLSNKVMNNTVMYYFLIDLCITQ